MQILSRTEMAGLVAGASRAAWGRGILPNPTFWGVNAAPKKEPKVADSKLLHDEIATHF